MIFNLNENKIQLRRREIIHQEELPDDLPPLLRRLYASRGIKNAKELERDIKKILSWKTLYGIKKAVSMLYEAFCRKYRIVIIGDFDTDGATSVALSVLSLRALGFNDVAYLIPNRFKNGYGLTPTLVDIAFYTYGAQMIMTVDNGIVSHAGIERAHQLGIPVLITDHHLPGETLPSAEAIINPNIKDCNFPSKSLSGVGVVLYLMLAFRAFLYKKKHFEKNNISVPKLAEYLDLVALGTVADLVPLDKNNRILTWQGLNRIRAGKCRPGIKALIKVSNLDPKYIAASDLSFSLSPRLNAAGRLHDMSIGVSLLLCENPDEAFLLACELDSLNKSRKEIEKEMHETAMVIFESWKLNNITFPVGLVIYHPAWHQGIIGILSSRIKEQFNRPVISFAPIGNGILKGSGRSIQGLHMLNVISQLDKMHPGLILNFGGHAMAVGLSLEEKRFKEFQSRFNEIIKKWLNPILLEQEIISDGPLSPEEMTIEMAQILKDAGPWGEMFPEPIFDGRFRLLNQKLVSNRHLKVLIEPINSNLIIEGIVFNINTKKWPDKNIHEVELVYKLDINQFRGNRNLQFIIDNIWPI